MEMLPPLAFGWNHGLFPARPVLQTHLSTPFYFESLARSRNYGFWFGALTPTELTGIHRADHAI